MPRSIHIRGARTHNLQNIDLEIPRDRLVVITGPSGSGKSSLAFDTIYAEGQRRYVESLSAYARQFLDQMEKPDVDDIEGLSPAIAIEQRTTSAHPRSTVATLTEIYDHLRLLFARIGVPISPHTGRELRSQSPSDVIRRLAGLPEGTRFGILSPVVRGQRGGHERLLEELLRDGFTRLRVDGQTVRLDDALRLDKRKRHDVDVYVDRIIRRPSSDGRIADSVELAFRLGHGLLSLEFPDDGREELVSEHCAEPETGFSMPPLEPRLFSFNSPHGACPRCHGLGAIDVFDPTLIVPDPTLSLADGAVEPLRERLRDHLPILRAVARRYGGDVRTPWKELPSPTREGVLYGTGDTSIPVRFEGAGQTYRFEKPYEGVIPLLERRRRETAADSIRDTVRRFARSVSCPECGGTRLRTEARCVRVSGLRIHEVVALSVDRALDWIQRLDVPEHVRPVAERPCEEIAGRLGFMQAVGLGYLGLDRSAATLSGGEAQRIRLATQIGRSLMGVLYVLDEPSIGLHARDTERLLATLRQLRDHGNSVIVVEHDEATIRAADHVIDLGPGAGRLGGRVTAEGPPDALHPPGSLTARYLRGDRRIELPSARRPPDRGWLQLRGARAHNLKGDPLRLPLGLLVGVSGVSGSGKSSLVHHGLLPALRGAVDLELEGADHIDKVIAIDQSPIGRTPRSNPATYTGLFSDIRELYAQLPESKVRGFKPGRFSFNVKGGRCETCQGDGVVRVDMQLLPDVYVPCQTCDGRRYNPETLQIRHQGASIADVLAMTVDEAGERFRAVPAMVRKLDSLRRVGLGYVQLGQGANTLSGGEAQRLKLAKELARRAPGPTLYVLDEPTTGLHFEDIRQLMSVLQSLVEPGHTVLVIEHDLDVLKCVDWLVDLGPEGGDLGGRILAEGPPERVAEDPHSITGRFLRSRLAR
jgi:excinuclease ABC subunit A